MNLAQKLHIILRTLQQKLEQAQTLVRVKNIFCVSFCARTKTAQKYYVLFKLLLGDFYWFMPNACKGIENK